jgi:hypothetical protein
MANNFGSSFLYIDLQYEQVNEYINSLVGFYVKVSTAAQLFNINPAKDVCIFCDQFDYLFTQPKTGEFIMFASDSKNF